MNINSILLLNFGTMIKMVQKNFFSLLTAVAILYLSFASSDTFDDVNVLDFENLDKVVHMCMYFGLMIVMIFENRSALKNNKTVFLMAIIPLTFGIVIEFLQSWLTDTREGDLFDAISDLAGIMIAILLWKIFLKISKKEFR
jgi:VanZ family protein